MHPMKIILDDIIFMLQRAGGISEYWKELSTGIKDINGIEVANIISPRGTISNFHRQYHKYKRCKTPAGFDGVFHSSYYRLATCKRFSVVTVHDFIYHKFYKGFTRYFNCEHISKAIKQADAIICISEATKKDLLYYHPELHNVPISTIYHGVDHSTFTISNREERSDFKDCVVFIGTRFDYKNFRTAVEAVSAVSDLRLAIIGAPLQPYELQIIEHNDLDYIELGYISKDELANIYSNAFCLLYPSLYEGFGMPILEAMASGLPVITSDHPAVLEVSGGGSLNGIGSDTESYINALNFVMFNRNELVKKGLAHSLTFNWQKCVKETLEVYSKLYE